MDIDELRHLTGLARAARERGLVARLGAQAGAIGDLGLLLARGPGAASFLHGQLTNDVAGLAPGRGNSTARVTRTGALTHLLTLHRNPGEGERERFALILDRSGVASLVADLDAYRFEDGVELMDASDAYQWLLVQGPESGAVMKELYGETVAESQEFDLHVPIDGALPGGSMIFARGLAGDRGFLIALPAGNESIREIFGALVADSLERGLVHPSSEELTRLLEMLRVEAGMPLVGVDMAAGERSLPETGLEEGIVDYDKGCYLGQEIIARMRSYGSPAHALRGLILSEATNEADWADALANLPDPGSPLVTEDGSTVGRIASRGLSPFLGAPVALAFLDRKHRTPSRQLKLQGKRLDFTATIALPPFHRSRATDADAPELYDRALHSFADRRDDEAMELLEAAIRLRPDYAEAYEALGVILGRSERYDEAIALFTRLEEIAPEEPMVNTNLSLYQMKIGNKERAEEEMAKATVKKFRAAAAAGAAEPPQEQDERQRREVERRLAMFREVLEMDPDDALALGGMGKGLADLERWEEAERYLRRACEREKDNAPLFETLGRVLEALDRRAEALSVYERGVDAASRKGSLMPLKKMEQRLLLLKAQGTPGP